MNLLEINRLSLSFDGLLAVNDFSWQVPPGSIQGLIGPNGAGKTNLFNLITGIFSPREGDIHFQGRAIAGLPPHRICRAGIARTFQNIRLLPEMTVLENVLMAGHGGLTASFWGAIFHPAEVQAANAALGEGAYFPAHGLSEERSRLAPSHRAGCTLFQIHLQAAGFATNQAVRTRRSLGSQRANRGASRMLASAS